MLLSPVPVRTVNLVRRFRTFPSHTNRQAGAFWPVTVTNNLLGRVAFSTDATGAKSSTEERQTNGRKGVAIALTAVTAASIAAYLHSRNKSDVGPKTLAGLPISSLSKQDQYIHSTLNRHASIHTFPPLNNAQIHSTFVASNSPVEDRLAIWAMPGPDRPLLVSVFDGHAGRQCAEVLHQWYGHYVARVLASVQDAGQAMATALDEFDADLMQLPEVVKTNMGEEGLTPDKVREVLLPAMSGSVVVSAMIDRTAVHVAHAGDSRAVIGRRSPSEWTAIPLTKDHNAENPAEVMRLKREHPGEEDTVITDEGRVIRGLNVFRSAGDGRFKWAKNVREWVCAQFVDSGYKYNRDIPWSLTPPYITAKCDVARHELLQEDEFLVLATDGLWEHVNESQVVDAIGAYLDSSSRKHLEKPSGGDGIKWALQDRNAAAHVIRNAVGGHDSDKVAKLFKIPYPESREHRDDITVVVVFLNKALEALPLVQGVDVEKVKEADPALGKMKVSVEKGLHV